jgi:AcrR family transcriptional regulator
MADSIGPDPACLKAPGSRAEPRLRRLAKLAPGPGMAPAEVAASQRARLRWAMTQIVGEKGFDAVKVRDLARLARVSSQAFYRNFTGKDQCLLEAYDDAVRGAARKIVAATGQAEDWEGRLRVALDTFLNAVADHPKAARLALIETYAVGPQGVERMRHTFGLAEVIVRDGFRQEPTLTVVESLLVKGVVGGIIGIVQMRLLEGREAELPAMTDRLAAWVLSFRGAETGALELRDAGLDRGEADRREISAREQGVGDDGDRALMLEAAARLARTGNLDQLTPDQICDAAGVPKKSFSQAFTDLRECLLTVADRTLDAAFRRGEAEAAAASDWVRGVRRVVDFACAEIAREPALARLGFTEMPRLGTEALRHRAAMIERVAEGLRDGAPADARPEDLAAEASVAAIWTIVQHQSVAGGPRSLRRFAPTLSFLALAPALGGDTAMREIRKEGGRELSPA